MKEGIRYKMVLSFGMNNGDTWEEVAKKVAQQSYHPLKLVCDKKYSRGLWSV